MSTQLKRRRGTAAENAAFTGAVGEIVALTDTGQLALHDASNAGGDLFLNSNDIFNNEEKYALAGGTANALTVTFTGKTAGSGTSFYIKAAATNTASVTLSFNGGGATVMKKSDPKTGTLVNLAANDLVVGGIYLIAANGTNYLLVNAGGGGTDQASAAEIAAESAVEKYISPDRLNESKRVARVAAYIDSSFNTVIAGYGISSISAPFGSTTRINFSTAFPNVNYVLSLDCESSTIDARVQTRTTGYLDIVYFNYSGAGGSIVRQKTSLIIFEV